MRVRRFLLLSLTLAACGGDDGSTATMPTSTSVTGNTTSSTNPSGETVTGPGESSESSETTPTSEASTMEPVAGAPVILSLQTNVSKLTAGESVVFTATLTDPDGFADIGGGTLSDEGGKIGYGPFVAAGQPGTYSITLSWDAMHQAEAIQFEGMDLSRVFQAEFYDLAANKVAKDVTLALTCAEGSACDGVCTDIKADANHCGSCSGVCEGSCAAGQCAPEWGECIHFDEGIDTCDQYCGSIGEACAENSCGPNKATIRGFGTQVSCANEQSPNSINEPCGMVQTWDIGRTDIQCCCTDTP